MPDEVVSKEASALLKLWNARKRDLSQGAFGMMYDLGTQGMVWQYLHGKRPLNVKAAVAFAKGLEVRVEDFSRRLYSELRQISHAANDPPVPYRVAEPNVEDVPAASSRLPLISWVSAGLKDEANDPYAPGNAEAWIDFDGQASSSAFCLRVRGRSMESPDGREPTFPDGCLIAVEPRRRPKSMEFAVFRFADTDEATFKQYVVNGPLKLLKPLNPDPEYKIIALSPDAQLVGTVFEKRIIGRY